MDTSAIYSAIISAILSQVFRKIAIAAASIGALSMIDVTNIGIPKEYEIPIIITAIAVVLIVGLLMRERLHDIAADKKVAEGKIASTNDLPFDKRYDIMTALGAIIGGFFGVFAGGVFISSYVVGAQTWTYVFFTAVFVAIFVVCAIYILHMGIRLFLVKAKEYSYLAKSEGSEAWAKLSDQEKANILAIIKPKK